MYVVQKQRTGELLTDYRDILNEQFHYYSELYTSNPNVKFNLVNKTEVKLSEQKKLEFELFVSKEELYDAMMTLKRGKVVGCDGISVEFYYKFWNQLVDDLHAMLKQAYEEGELSFSARKGVINLLPKPNKNDKILASWRPISLLCYDYKIYAKALSNRMDTVTKDLVGQQQTGFIKGRSIQNNIAKTREVLTYLNRRNLPAVIAIVDYEKCFDRLEYKSIEEAPEILQLR